MKLTKEDIIAAMKLRVFILRYNLDTTKAARRKIALEELREIERQLLTEDCVKASLNPMFIDQSESNRTAA